MELLLKNSDYYSGEFTYNNPTVIITGACRSGKTTIGNILATCDEVEYADEPWFMMQISHMMANGTISTNKAKGLIPTYLSELLNDLILLRGANFRIDDLSSIWTKKRTEEILYRLTSVKSRADVQALIKENKTQLILTLSEAGPTLSNMTQHIGDVKVIHVVRNGLEVAQAIADKKWFSNENLKRPNMAMLTSKVNFKNTLYYIPWWVKEEDVELFLTYNDLERGLFYWCSIIEYSISNFKKVKNVFTLNFESLLINPTETSRTVMDFLGLRMSKLAELKINDIKKSKVDIRPLEENISSMLLENYKSLFNKIENG
jgi:hypothetical protein